MPLADRVLLVAVHYRTNLTYRQIAPLFGISKSAVDRVIDHLAPLLALSPATKKHSPDTVLIVDGMLVPTYDRAIRVEHALCQMRCWSILRNCRRTGDGVYYATAGVALMRNPAMTW